MVTTEFSRMIGTSARKFFVVILFGLLISACRDNPDRVPNVPVDITINVNEPAWFNIQAVTGWVYITGGSRGIIIYRKSFDEFVALERHVPYNVQDGCAAVVTSDNVIVEDPCSGSQWIITDGSLIQGPASFNLTTYETIFTDPVLRIFN
jgi:hypothetical protein